MHGKLRVVLDIASTAAQASDQTVWSGIAIALLSVELAGVDETWVCSCDSRLPDSLPRLLRGKGQRPKALSDKLY
eukprot:4087029-Amphidinium_carterae.1